MQILEPFLEMFFPWNFYPLSLQIPFLAISHGWEFWSLSLKCPFLEISTPFLCKFHSLQFHMDENFGVFPWNVLSLKFLPFFFANSIPCNFTWMRILESFLEMFFFCNFHPLSLQIPFLANSAPPQQCADKKHNTKIKNISFFLYFYSVSVSVKG